MRPDDRRPNLAWSSIGDVETFDMPLDTGLGSLDDELGEAGARARAALHGRTQPTRVFSNRLREQLLGTVADAGVSSTVVAAAPLPRESLRLSRRRFEPAGPEGWAPTPLQPRLARRTPTVLPRARWSLLAAAALTTVVVAGALGARFDWLLPLPTAETSPPPSGPSETPRSSPAASVAALLPVATPAPTKPGEKPRTTPSPKPTSKPKPTQKPESTTSPVKPMGLTAKACPGGVVLDWSKPSSGVGHYHVLRNIDGGVPATYPADGTTEVESATSWSAGVTDGFDAGLDGGESATYRSFAFDDEDELMAFSPSRTVTASPPRSLGPLDVEVIGPGSIEVTWSGSEVPGACFSYGKLVASSDDSDPSYLKGSPHLTAIGDQATTSVTLDELPSGETVWMRYELIRVTGTGKFVVGRSDVLQVTYP